MSRVYDALRRGRSPADPSPAGRTANADAVLTTLGYKSERKRRSNAGLMLGVIVVGLAAAGIWWMLTGAGSPREIRPKEPASAVSVTKGVHSKPPDARPVQSKPPEARLAEQAPSTAAAQRTTLTRGPVPAQAVMLPSKAVPVPPTGVPAQPKAGAAPGESQAVAETESASSGSARPNTDDFRLGLYYQRAGDFELALVHYKAVLQRDELNVDAHNNLGNLYMSKGLFDEAAREFLRVIAVEPGHVTAHVNLSAALYQLKRYDEAAAEARTAIRLDGRNGDALVNLALSQTASGQPGEARASLTHALEIDRHNAAAHYNLALQYEKAGEVGLALEHYRAFLQYAAPEQAGYAADVRARVRALESKREPGASNREPLTPNRNPEP